MADMEKLLDGLRCRATNFPERDCAHCHYGIQMGRRWGCDFMRMTGDAIALLKAQEPRVMAWDEVRAAMKAPIWKETKSMHKALYQGWVLAYDIQTGQGITGTRLGMAEPSGRVVWYKVENYGKTWRCWSAPPTDAQREAVKWE